IPSHVEPGADVTITVSVSCPVGCDLSGQRIQVSTGAGPLIESELLPPESQDSKDSQEGQNSRESQDFKDVTITSTAPFVVHAPEEAGEQLWKIRFPNYQYDGSIHRATIALVP